MNTPQALANLRIVDMTRVLAGPYCTQMLGDMGADIIKIEQPRKGDDTRKWGPPFAKDADGNDTAESAYYLSANRNKRSLAVDIADAQGQEVIHDLLAKSDALIENFKVGGLAKYGLSYDDIQARHPHLIYVSITGFGQNGPLAREPGYDFLAQGLSGIMACTGEPDAPPMKVGVALSDVMTGLNAAIAILAAVNARHQTGKGQHIDLSLLDCSVASMVNLAQYYLTSGNIAPRLGNAHSTIVPYQAFASADGHIILAVGNDTQFADFCRVVGKEDWASDERFSTNPARVANRAALLPMIEAIVATKTTAHWITTLPDNNVPCGPVNTMDQVFEMEQIKAREMVVKMPHAASGSDVKLVGNPLKFSDTPVSYSLAPPSCGEHSAEILRDILGMDEGEINALGAQGIVELPAKKA